MLSALLARIIPPPGLTRTLALQSLLFGIGEGTFMTANAVYFTQVMGLTAQQVGAGVSIFTAVSLVLAIPLGRVVDRLGARRSWIWFSGLWGLAYLAWPFAHGMAGYIGVLVWSAVADTVSSSGRGAYVLDALGQEQRVRSQAFMYSALNTGFSIGAGAGAIALAVPGLTAVRVVPFFAFAVFAVNLVMVARLPELVRPGAAIPSPAPAPAGGTTTDEAPAPGDPSRTIPAWRNLGYSAMALCQGLLHSHQTLLSIVIPLWLVTETHAPRPFLAVLVATNTLGVVLFQVVASRGSHTVAGALRATNIAVACFIVACVLIMNTGTTLGLLTVALIWLAHVAITGAEVFETVGTWGLEAELSDPARRAEYLGVSRFGARLSDIVTPVLYTWLAMRWGAPGWITIAVLFVAVRVALSPAVAAASRAAARRRASTTAPAPDPQVEPGTATA